MDLYNLWLLLQRATHQQFKIKAIFVGQATLVVFIDNNIYCYVTMVDGSIKLTFADSRIPPLEHVNDNYIFGKIMSTLQIPKL